MISRQKKGIFLIRTLLILLPVFGAMVLQAQYSEQPSLSKYQLPIDAQTQRVTLGRLGEASTVSFQSIKKAKPQSFAEFLDLIQQKAPQMFDQAVVIHTSGSLQPSHPQQPRVILYGANVSMSVATSEVDSQRVEFLQFNPETLDFSMHEIIFKEGGGADFHDRPKECSSCHGIKPKPVWEAYDFWPSALGSQAGMALSVLEKQWIDAFQQTELKHPIWKKINKQNLKEAIDTFTAFLSQQNFLATSKGIETHLSPDGKLYPFRYALLGLLSCTDKSFGASPQDNIIYRDFIPKNVEAQWSISFMDVYQDVLASNQRVKDDLWDYYLRSFPGSLYPGVPGLTRLRTNEIVQGSQLGTIFSNLELDLKDFTLSFRQDSYILSTPNLFEFELQKTWLYFMPEILDEIDHTVRNLGGPDFQFFEFNCDQLKEKSQESLAHYSQASQPYFSTALYPHSGMAPYGMCVSCHSRKPRPGGMQPPYIPFEDTWQLGEVLRTTDLLEKIKDRINREDLKQMPKDLPHLNEAQKQSLLSVLQMIEQGSRPQ